jgi:protein-tyrosine-phosphatase
MAVNPRPPANPAAPGPAASVDGPGRGSLGPLRLLFVCVENANRSQMAEAFARLLGGARVEAASAGSRPSGRVNPKAVEAMRELGVDLTSQRSKSIAELGHQAFDAVVTMGCGDACPNVRARLREDWSIPDPRELDPAAFRVVRDRIRREVADLLARLGVQADPAPGS